MVVRRRSRRRPGDLSAGKTELSDGVERVTAALRGEAESDEYLGLSLSETSVRAYAESQGLLFETLTDGEKAQLRYNLLLEQSNGIQGKAAAAGGIGCQQEGNMLLL